MKALLVVVAAAGVLVACASAGDAPESAPTATVGTTTTASTATTTTQAPETTSAASPGPEVCDDPTGDPADPEGNSPSSIPAGMDLTGARLTRTGDAITVRIESDPGPPTTTAEPFGLFWSVDAWRDENTGYQLRISLDGDEWTVEVFDFTELSNEVLDTVPTVSAMGLTVEFPIESAPALEDTFSWAVVTEWGDLQLFNDACPGGGTSTVAPEDRLTLPDR